MYFISNNLLIFNFNILENNCTLSHMYRSIAWFFLVCSLRKNLHTKNFFSVKSGDLHAHKLQITTTASIKKQTNKERKKTRTSVNSWIKLWHGFFCFFPLSYLSPPRIAIISYSKKNNQHNLETWSETCFKSTRSSIAHGTVLC